MKAFSQLLVANVFLYVSFNIGYVSSCCFRQYHQGVAALPVCRRGPDAFDVVLLRSPADPHDRDQDQTLCSLPGPLVGNIQHRAVQPTR